MLGSILVVLLLISVLILRSLDSYYFITQPFLERWFYLQGFLRMAQEHFWIGVGIGQSVYLMPHFFVEKLFEWQLQPIHNLFLLIWAEIGAIGLILFMLICSTWNKLVTRPTLFHVEQLRSSFFDDITTVPRGTIFHENFIEIFSACRVSVQASWIIGKSRG
jgi:O-antigen ligase